MLLHRNNMDRVQLQTDGQTDKMIPIYPPPTQTLLGVGVYNKSIDFFKT